MENIINLENFIPSYTNVSITEKEFSDSYINRFELSQDDDIETPFVVLFPQTLQDLVLDIVNEYNMFLQMKIGTELINKDTEFFQDLNIFTEKKEKSDTDLS